MIFSDTVIFAFLVGYIASFIVCIQVVKNNDRVNYEKLEETKKKYKKWYYAKGSDDLFEYLYKHKKCNPKRDKYGLYLKSEDIIPYEEFVNKSYSTGDRNSILEQSFIDSYTGQLHLSYKSDEDEDILHSYWSKEL